MANPIPVNLLFKHPVLILATGFGSGLAPKAPGTFGTLAAIPIYVMVSYFDSMTYWITFLILFLIGILICNRATEILKVHDHPSIVWDEIVGYLITMYSLPQNWTLIIAGFLVFRFFDILKPWPIKMLDKTVKGGFGIMLDDVVAGVSANLVLQIGIFVLGYFGYFLV